MPNVNPFLPAQGQDDATSPYLEALAEQAGEGVVLDGQDDDHRDVASLETEDRNLLRLQEKAGRFDEATSRADAAERGIGFYEAGIDIRTDLGAFFATNYSGDVADVEALKAEAARLGVPRIA